MHGKQHLAFTPVKTFICSDPVMYSMDDLISAIRGWNPWWIQAWTFPPTIYRELTGKIESVSEATHIKDIIGIRRSGKSTVMAQLIESRVKGGNSPDSMMLINFEDPVIKAASFMDLQNSIFLINPDVTSLFLDEIQEKSGWEQWVRAIYDTRRFKAIFISGSSAALLTADIGRVLSGRHLSFVLHPFSFGEYLHFCKWTDFSIAQVSKELPRINHYLEKYLLNGGFPEVVIHEETLQRRILTDLFKDIIYRDIIARHPADADKVQALAIYFLTNWTRTFSYNKIASALNLHVETVEKYLNYMKEAFLIFVLNRFAFKLQTQYREEKKIYVIDAGLRNYIAFQTTKDRGKAAENAVFLELKRREHEIYYWKEGNREVDFIITHGAEVQELIQVAWDLKEESTRKREIDGLIAAAREFKKDHGTIITFDVEAEEAIEGIRITYKPIATWLLIK
jgi:predicted AAA+ superfamily ATPase